VGIRPSILPVFRKDAKDYSMHILVTNDDGITHPGLLALAQALHPLGQVSVLAPERNWSASGHVKTLDHPLRVKETTLADDTPALTTDGAPSDCVALALLGLLPPVDLVVSGINPHANLGHDVTYSGTVTAAMEAAIGGVPGIAVSLNTPENGPRADFLAAGNIARRIAAQVIAHGLPPATLLNVNVPFLPEDQICGIRDKLEPRRDPRGRPYYWIGGEAPTGVLEAGTDIGGLAQGFVTVTPLQLDLTAYPFMDKLKEWQWEA
jgi:5'-nucleotidase